MTLPEQMTEQMRQAFFDAKDRYPAYRKKEREKGYGWLPLADYVYQSVLSAAPIVESAPVVWIIRDPFGNRVGYEDGKERAAQLTKAGYKLTPLYTHSTPADVTVIDGFAQQDPSSLPTTDEHNAMLLDQIEELREALHPQVARNRKLVAENAELVKAVEKACEELKTKGTEWEVFSILQAALDKDK